MATQDAQTLTTFTENALKRLRETVDPKEISDVTKELYAEAGEYPTFRKLFERGDIRKSVGKALSNRDAEGFKIALLGALAEVAREGRPEHVKEAPGPDPFTSEEQYASTVRLSAGDRVAQFKGVEEASELYQAQKKSAERRRFAEQLTANFISRSKIQITEEQRQAEVARTESELSLDWYRRRAEINRTIAQSPYAARLSDRDLQQILSDGEKTAQNTRVVQDRIEQVLEEAAATIASTDEAVVRSPKAFIEIAADQAEQSNKPIPRVVNEAARIERATNGFSEGVEPISPSLSLLAENPLQKGFAALVDRLPEGTRNAITNVMVGGALDRTVDRMGESLAGQQWVQNAIANGSRGLPDKQGALRSISSGITKLFGETADLIFRGQMDEAAIAYFTAMRQGTTVTTAVAPQQFVTAAAYAQNPNLFSYGLHMGLQYGLDKAKSAAIKAGIQKVAAGAAGKGLATLAGGLGTGGWGFVAAGAAGLFNAGVGLLKKLIGVGEGGVSWDKGLLIATACVALVFFIPLIPFLNLPAFNQALVDGSLASSLGVGSGVGEGPSVICQNTPEDPLCTFTACVGDCRWPISGYITQGPRTGQFCSTDAQPTHGSGSPSSQNAIDFASLGGGAIYATKKGTVQRVFTGCPESGASIDPWCGGGPDPTRPGDSAHPEYAGYGNHVVLLTDNGYTVIFGHLKSAIGVKYGQVITDPNTQIGWVDNSGHSFGTHLHFGVLSGGSVLNLIPTDNPTLGPSAIDGCIQQTNGCTKICPTIPVKAGS